MKKVTYFAVTEDNEITGEPEHWVCSQREGEEEASYIILEDTPEKAHYSACLMQVERGEDRVLIRK